MVELKEKRVGKEGGGLTSSVKRSPSWEFRFHFSVLLRILRRKIWLQTRMSSSPKKSVSRSFFEMMPFSAI